MNLTTYYDVFNSGQGLPVPSIRLRDYIANIGSTTNGGPGQFSTDGRVNLSAQGQLKSAAADLQTHAAQIATRVNAAKESTGEAAARGGKSAAQLAAEASAAGAGGAVTPPVRNQAAEVPQGNETGVRAGESRGSAVIERSLADVAASQEAGTKAGVNQRADLRQANLLTGDRQATVVLGQNETERANEASRQINSRNEAAVRQPNVTPAQNQPPATSLQAANPVEATPLAAGNAGATAPNQTAASASPNPTQLRQSAEALVQAVNHFVDQAQALANAQPHNPAVTGALKSVTQVFANATPNGNPNTAATVGLTQGADGRIAIDQARLQSAIAANPTGTQTILTRAVTQVGQAANSAVVGPQRQSEAATRAGFSNGENPYLVRPSQNATPQPPQSVIPVPSTTLLSYSPTTRNLYGLGQYLAVSGL